MTWHHLAGELSVLLADLQSAADSPASSSEAARLRREAESESLEGLALVVRRALDLSDRGCWDLLSRGDTADFARRAAMSAKLWEFASAAGLVEDD